MDHTPKTQLCVFIDTLFSFLFLGARPNCAEGVDDDEGQDAVIDSSLSENKNLLLSILSCIGLTCCPPPPGSRALSKKTQELFKDFINFCVLFESLRFKE